MATKIYLGYSLEHVKKWIKEHYKPDIDMTKVPLTFTAEEPNAVVKMVKNGQAPTVTLETSVDDGASWQPFTVGETEITLANVGDKVMFRNSSDNIQVMATDSSNYNRFDLTSGKVAASGNIMFLMDKTGELRDLTDHVYCFYKMFENCSSLTSAPELPATTLANRCYCQMFYYCSSLTQAPELHATTLAYRCYGWMFENCSSLTQAPELPVKTLAEECYCGMFYGCTSLTQAPELPATTLADYCYRDMFARCNKLTSITISDNMTSIDNGMFFGCSSLSSVVIGNGVTNIGKDAFYNCERLTSVTIPNIVTSIGQNAFYNCNSLTSVTFQGKTLEQVQAMQNYSWGISNTSIINMSSESIDQPENPSDDQNGGQQGSGDKEEQDVFQFTSIDDEIEIDQELADSLIAFNDYPAGTWVSPRR